MQGDLIYLAAFLEADGCVQLTGIRITNKCLDVLDWMEETFGGQIRAKGTPEDCWEWNIHAEKAEELLRKLYPYLKFKGPQVDLFFEYRETIQSKGSKLSEHILIKRDVLKDKLSKEKHKWMSN